MIRETARIALYALIAGLTTAQGWQSALDWRFPVAVGLAMCIAVKASLSQKKDEPDQKPPTDPQT